MLPFEEPLFSDALRNMIETSVIAVGVADEVNDWANQFVPCAVFQAPSLSWL